MAKPKFWERWIREDYRVEENIYIYEEEGLKPEEIEEEVKERKEEEDCDQNRNEEQEEEKSCSQNFSEYSEGKDQYKRPSTQGEELDEG